MHYRLHDKCPSFVDLTCSVKLYDTNLKIILFIKKNASLHAYMHSLDSILTARSSFCVSRGTMTL